MVVSAASPHSNFAIGRRRCSLTKLLVVEHSLEVPTTVQHYLLLAGVILCFECGSLVGGATGLSSHGCIEDPDSSPLITFPQKVHIRKRRSETERYSVAAIGPSHGDREPLMSRSPSLYSRIFWNVWHYVLECSAYKPVALIQTVTGFVKFGKMIANFVAHVLDNLVENRRAFNGLKLS